MPEGDFDRQTDGRVAHRPSYLCCFFAKNELKELTVKRADVHTSALLIGVIMQPRGLRSSSVVSVQVGLSRGQYLGLFIGYTTVCGRHPFQAEYD